MGNSVASYMDALESRSWKWRKSAEESGEVAADKLFGYEDKTEAQIIADVVEDLLGMCDGEISYVMDALEAWRDSRDSRFDPHQPDAEERGPHLIGLAMSIGLTGIGNLFGFIPDDALAHSPDLAAEGRRRGWRR